MLLNAERSVLLHIDIQERLLPALHAADAVIEHSLWLTRIARELAIPVRATEQYPKGLQHTTPALRELLRTDEIWIKEHFSCAADAGCLQPLQALKQQGRDQLVLTGAETHVCVLQSALQLKQAGFQVFLVEEAVTSRRPSDKAAALQRMRQQGIEIVTREMVVFEWLHKCNTELFRLISKHYIK